MQTESPMICVQKANGFVGSGLMEALRARRLPHCLLEEDIRCPVGPRILLLNRWNSVPSSTAASARGEVIASLLPLLDMLDDSIWDDVLHVVFLSSAGAVYGPTSGLAEETALPSPSSNYGAGKLAAEAFLRVAASRRGFPLTILRPSNLYGPGQFARPGFGIVPAIHAALNGREPVRIWAGAEVRKDYLYIDDFIDALICVLLGDPPEAGQVKVFNVASGYCANVSELLSLSRALQRCGTLETEMFCRQVFDVSVVAPDASCFRERYRWQPRYDLGTGLKAAFAWLDGCLASN